MAKCECGRAFNKNLDYYKCACGQWVVTGYEKAIRKTVEAWASGPHTAYPKVAVARAIGYAAGIYKLATDSVGIAYDKIEQQIGKKYGGSAKATSTEEADQLRRQLRVSSDKIVSDLGVGVVVTVVRGPGWAQIYVVFRGSRGEGVDSNPNQAGWGNFDGTLQCIDWMANLKSRNQVPMAWCDRGLVHEGFYELYSSNMERIKDLVLQRYNENFVEAHPPAVIVAGHSLGAAQATLCAHHLARGVGLKPFCFTFNSPRVGNLGFVRDFNFAFNAFPGTLRGEPGGKSYERAFAFQRSSDPVSEGVEHGVGADINRDVANYQAPVKGKYWTTGPILGLLAQSKAIKKVGVSNVAIYYHIQNRVKLSWSTMFTAHDFGGVEKELLGREVSKKDQK